MFCRLLRLFVRNRSGEGKVDLVIKEYFLLISFKRKESCKKLISYPFRFTFKYSRPALITAVNFRIKLNAVGLRNASKIKRLSYKI